MWSGHLHVQSFPKLTQNCIFKGKTLIACMLLKKFKMLNKERMGLFIVDRVSLADQQAKVTNSLENFFI